MFMNVVAIMIDYVGFLGLFTGSGRFCAPISLFLGHPCDAILDLWHVSSQLVHFCHETNARKNTALFWLFYS